MATISAGDLTKLREQQQYSTIYLAILQPDSILQARVNDAGIARGDRSIIYDSGTGTAGEFSRIAVGHTLWVGTSAGTYDVGKVRVKSISGNEVSGTITIAENGIDWIDDLYLTIKEEYQIWPIPPRISGGIFYKDHDITYSDQNEEPPPISIMGPHRAGFLSSGSVVFTLDGSDSYAIAQGAAISSYAWTTTGGVIANAAIATTTITFNTAGYYWVSLEVTDDNGKTQITHRCFFVYDTANPPYRDFTVSNYSGNWNSAGWQFSADLYGDLTLDDVPDSTLCLLWHQNYIDDALDYVNIWDIGDEVICAGYVQRDIDTDDLAQSGTGSASFTVVSPTLYLNNKNIMATVSLEANSSPSFWYEYETWLTCGRAIHHLLKWHSTVLETCDLLGLTDNTLQVFQTVFTEDSLLDMVNELAFKRGIFAKMVSAKDGRLYLVEDSNYLDETDRNALDTIFTIIAQDLSGAPQLAREPLEKTSLAFLDGLDYDGSGIGTPYISIIPGYIDSISIQIPEFWGRGNANKQRQIIDSQSDANIKTGRVLHVANNPLRELRLSFRANYLGAFDIVPSNGWYRWGIANALLKRGLDLLNTDWLCRTVNLRFPTGELWRGVIEVNCIFEGEAFGEDGIPGNYPTSYPTPVPPDPNWTIPVAVYGYWAGGFTGVTLVAIADRINFSTEVTAASAISDLSLARDTLGSLGDKTTYGYFAGGFGVSRTAIADRIIFSTSVTAANAASDRSTATSASPGLSDGSLHGYWSGGNDGSLTDVTDRIILATGVTSAYPTGNLTGNRQEHTSISDGSAYGYWLGGRIGVTSGSMVDTVERTNFSTGVTASIVSTLSVARVFLAGMSDNSIYGYALGGSSGAITYYDDTDRLTFATATIATNVISDLSEARQRPGGLSDGMNNGFIAGGDNGAGYRVTADKIALATGVTAANATSNLSTARSVATNTGVSDGAI